VGDAAYNNYMDYRVIGLKKQLLEKLRGYFGEDIKVAEEIAERKSEDELRRMIAWKNWSGDWKRFS